MCYLLSKLGGLRSGMEKYIFTGLNPKPISIKLYLLMNFNNLVKVTECGSIPAVVERNFKGYANN